MGLAGRGRGAPRLHARRRPVRRRATPRRRHRRWRLGGRARSGRGRGDLRRPGADARGHRDDPDGGRRQGLADASRRLARRARRARRGGCPDRVARLLRRSRARRAVRPSGRPPGRRDVRRPPESASTAGRLPSASACGAARTCSSRARAGAASGGRACGRDAAAPGARGRAACGRAEEPTRRIRPPSHRPGSGRAPARPAHVRAAGRKRPACRHEALAGGRARTRAWCSSESHTGRERPTWRP